MLSIEQTIKAAKDEGLRRSGNEGSQRQRLLPEGLIALLQFVELSEQELARTVKEGRQG